MIDEPKGVGPERRHQQLRSTAATHSGFGRFWQLRGWRLALDAGGGGGRRRLLRRAGRLHILVRADGARALRAVRRLAARVARRAPLAGSADRDGEWVLAQHLTEQVARRAIPDTPATLSAAHERAHRAVATKLLQLHARARSRVERHAGHALRLLQPRRCLRIGQALARRLAHLVCPLAPLAQRARRRDALLWRRRPQQRGNDGAGALRHRQPERTAAGTDLAWVGALLQEQLDELHTARAGLGARAGQLQQWGQVRRVLRGEQ